MASVEDVSRLAFQNLLLLGLDVEEMSSKHGIIMNAGTLVGPIASQKAMEIVLHFIMLKLFPSEAGQALKLLWPIVDKSQQRDFRKFVTDKFVQLQKDRELLPVPPIRGAVIDNPVGPKFCQLLLQATQLIMKRQIKMHRPYICTQPPSFKRGYSSALIRVCQMHLIRERDTFLKSVADILSAQDYWKSTSEKLISVYDSAQREQADFRAKFEILIAKSGTEFLTERSMTDRQSTANHTMESWRDIQSILGSPQEITITESVIFSNDERARISVTNGCPEIAGTDQLELPSLLKRWAASISQLQRHLTRNSACRTSLERLSEKEADLNNLVSNVAGQSEMINCFHQQLKACLLDLEKSVDLLQSEVQRILSEESSATPPISRCILQGGTAQEIFKDDVNIMEVEQVLCASSDVRWLVDARESLHGTSCERDVPSLNNLGGWFGDSKMETEIEDIIMALENAKLPRDKSSGIISSYQEDTKAICTTRSDEIQSKVQKKSTRYISKTSK
jgi:hypothetical protein